MAMSILIPLTAFGGRLAQVPKQINGGAKENAKELTLTETGTSTGVKVTPLALILAQMTTGDHGLSLNQRQRPWLISFLLGRTKLKFT